MDIQLSDQILAGEFTKVINCTYCTALNDTRLLRDSHENVPKPGYVGDKYHESHLLIVGQNPGVSLKRLTDDDIQYTQRLVTLRDHCSVENLALLRQLQMQVEPKWPMNIKYLPLQYCSLNVHQFAYINLVRCRTLNNAAPRKFLRDTCIRQHFEPWLDLLVPRVVVFMGKWASRYAGSILNDRQIPWAYINRSRSLSLDKIRDNLQQVGQFIVRHIQQSDE